MKEKIILAGLNRSQSQEEFTIRMDEMESLAEACGLEVAARVIQNSDTYTKRTVIGSGKTEELRLTAQAEDAEVIVFYNPLTPMQIRNLEKETECQVIDRTALILNIFALRARTREAMLQVQTAQLKYSLPRVIMSKENLDQQQGGAGVINRGSGERKTELLRRDIERAIAQNTEELRQLSIQKQVQKNRRQQSGLFQAALVGYSNAGKSSLMNIFLKESGNEEKQVEEKDMLFATLDPSVRKIQFDRKTFLLTDTVGFVSDLPKELIQAFESTLKEVLNADLLIHVLDASNEHLELQREATQETLKAIGAENIPSVTVYNKTDLVPEFERNDGISISCKTLAGIPELIQAVHTFFFEGESYDIFLPYSESELISMIKEKGTVQELNNTEEGIQMKLTSGAMLKKRLERWIR